ncbi:hypothetical protein U1Q18_001762 [Sarracenia purpurea var. burkii]
MSLGASFLHVFGHGHGGHWHRRLSLLGVKTEVRVVAWSMVLGMVGDPMAVVLLEWMVTNGSVIGGFRVFGSFCQRRPVVVAFDSGDLGMVVKGRVFRWWRYLLFGCGRFSSGFILWWLHNGEDVFGGVWRR